MKPADLSDLQALWRDVMEWLPPASESDDPAAAWRTVTLGEFRAWRNARDARLVERLANILERSRLSIERDIESTATYAPTTMQGREPNPDALH